MIASTVSVARPLVVKQASVQPKRQRTVVMAVSDNHNEASTPAVDRRRIIPLMLLPALLLAADAKPAAAIGKDVRQAAREREARKAKMREDLKAKTAKALAAKAPATPAE